MDLIYNLFIDRNGRLSCALIVGLGARISSAPCMIGWTMLIPSENRNLKYLYHVCTIVADERYRLYRDFFTKSTVDGKPQNRLPEYLLAMREVALAALEGGNRDPFSVLSQ